MTQTSRLYRHNDRDAQGAKFVKTTPCDACGKSTNEAERYTDDEVCNGSDAPGFYLCHRKRCAARYVDLPVESRRTMFNAQRAINDSRKES